MRIYKHLLILTVLVGVFSSSSASENDVNISKYLTVDSAVEPEKLWPMDTVLDFNASEYPTIINAIQALLDHIGYQLHSSVEGEPYSVFINNPVPPVHAQFKLNSIKEIVHALMGPSFNIRVDPVYRLVAFEIAPEFVQEEE